MDVSINVHEITRTIVKDLHDGKEPEFSVVEVATAKSDVSLFFGDLTSIIEWATLIVKEAERLQKEAKVKS